MRKRKFWGITIPAWVQRPQAWLSHRVYNLTRTQRIVCASIAGVLLLSVIVPTALTIIKNQSYQLSAEIQQLIGAPNKNLSSKITYNSEKDSWQFNQSDIPIGSSAQQAAMPSAADLKAQIGGAGKKDESLYAVDMPTSGTKGVTYYDTNTDLSFSLVPQFKVGEGRQSDGRIVYPSDHGAKLIYTAKGNGMKEDIVLTKPIGDELEFSYQLKLPDTLQAKIQADGSLGVFSPDPVLFGNISYGDGQDKEKLLSARKTAAKDHLLFVLPAPVIVEAGGKQSKAPAKFTLSDGVLTVKASGLEGLHYPLSIDPSVVVTSSSDFESGNSEGNIDYPSGAINRGAVTGGGVGAWTSTGSSPYTARWGMGTAVYNGYIYVAGGITGSGASTDVSYALIDGSGTVGAWATTTALPAAREFPSVVAYNGYLYAYGGYTSGTSALNSVVYAPINSNGTIGSWTTSSNTMGTATCRAGSAVYNGYLYAVGGATGTVAADCGNSSATNTGAVQYAPVQGNGDVGAWSSSSNTVTARKDVGVTAYNGYLYAIGGTTDGSSTSTTVQYASFKSTGDINSWTTSATTVTGNFRFGLTAHKGYIYLVGGNNGGTTISYAMIAANGDIGAFRTSTTIGTSRYGLGVVGYKGYIYITGGYDNPNTAYLNSTIYAPIDPAGANSNYTSTTAFTTARRGHMTVVYNNRIYIMGGDAGGAPGNSVRRADLQADGSLSSFTNDTVLPSSGGAGSIVVTYGSAVAYQGYMYVIGGCTNTYTSCTTSGSSAVVKRALINQSTGGLGSWSTTDASITTARYGASAVAYNGYLYIIGGLSGSTFLNSIEYHAIGASGAISGSWTTSSYTVSTARAYAGADVDGGKLYIAGGCSAGATTCSTAQSDIQYGTFGTSGELTGALTANGTSFTNARGMLGFAIDSGYAYVAGGLNNGTYYSDTQFAPLNSNGSIGSWTTGQALSTATAAIGIGITNGYMYAVGGYNGSTYYATTYYARLNAGGSGAISSWTTNTGNLTSIHPNSYATAYYNGYLYLMGGRTVSAAAAVETYYAPINADGSVGSWTQTTSMLTARSYFTAQVSGGYVYIVGGNDNSTGRYSSTEYAPLNSNGTIGSWTTATATLASARGSGASAVYNGYIYYLGGYNGSLQTGVYYANVANGGNFSSWSTGTTLPAGVSGSSAVAYNGYLYLVGGWNGSDVSRVLYAQINSNGSLGSWNDTSWLQVGGAPSVVAANGLLYAVGYYSWTSSNGLGYNYRAVIHADGSLGTFKRMPDVTAPDENKGVFYANGRLYLPGNDGNVYVGSLETMPRVGRYSKLTNLSGSYSLTGLTYNGTLPNGDSANITYRAASSNGAFGSTQKVSGLSGTSPTCSSATTNYVQTSIALDDTYTSVYPDANSTAANVTDFTLSYSSPRAQTSQRLMHGKHFTSEAKQGLDTCAS